MEKALLVSIKFKTEKTGWSMDDVVNELEELTRACGAQIVDHVNCFCEKPAPRFFVGKGKAEEIALAAAEEGADTVIFSRDLSGTQQRNLEEVIGKKTIDRTQLILDIFARHAKTPEGKTQVELAQLQYLMPRLVGQGIILSRLGGGIGTSGPGEQKLEVDRRRIRKRIDRLRVDLRHLSLHRQTLRKQRKENAVPTVALVGYTNAGKSTLINTLTHAGQLVQDSLFTTLDPLAQGLKLSGGGTVVISDTVGFLNNLPHHLIEAFKATLEEVIEADLLIHVLDAGHPLVREYAKAVYAVLKELHVEEKPMITALNKIDLVENKAWIDRLAQESVNPVPISAKFGINLDQLLARVGEFLEPKMLSLDLVIPHRRMDLVDIFYRQGQVKDIKYMQKGIEIKVSLPKIVAAKLLKDKDIERIC
ncbi:MAG TPA: GTPase HflX [Patescibacteria group bacterium]|nr:GTPase HflX [Patescibacteria group bacterium]